SGRLGRMIAADPRLHVPFGLVEGGGYAGAVGIADPIIATDERRKRDAFRRREGRIPGRTMRDSRDCLAALVRVCASGLMLDERRARQWMLAVCESLKLVFLDAASHAPVRGQTSIPLAPDLVRGRVVVGARVCEFLRVIRADLGGAERLG